MSLHIWSAAAHHLYRASPVQDKGQLGEKRSEGRLLALDLTKCQRSHIAEPPTTVCPKCAKAEAHRLISGGTNFILKGGGWYSDLYSSSKSTTKKEGEGAKTSGTTAETKSDSGGTKSESKPSSGGKTEGKTAAAA